MGILFMLDVNRLQNIHIYIYIHKHFLNPIVKLERNCWKTEWVFSLSWSLSSLRIINVSPKSALRSCLSIVTMGCHECQLPIVNGETNRRVLSRSCYQSNRTTLLNKGDEKKFLYGKFLRKWLESKSRFRVLNLSHFSNFISLHIYRAEAF